MLKDDKLSNSKIGQNDTTRKQTDTTKQKQGNQSKINKPL